jgi:hypothetical protein
MKIQPVPPIYRPTDYKGSNERKRPVKHPQGDMPRTGGKNDLNT